MIMERDYYEVLGLEPDADGTAVNRAYWTLAKTYQAQAADDPRAHAALDELNEAYNVLGTPALRDAYDAERGERVEPTREAAPRGRQSTSDARVTRSALSRVNSRATAPYAGAAVIGIAAVGVAVWSGSVLLMGAVLAIAALASAIAYLNHRSRATRDEPAPSSATVGSPPHSGSEERLGAVLRRRTVSADELRLSTASMVGRWRSVAGAVRDDAGVAVATPDATLVDIFRSEEEINDPSEPLSAALDVLRGSRRPL
jgi:curved DNA-binding protein CbpA